MGDKAFTEELPETVALEAEAVEAAPVEEVDLEAALGGGIRKAPAAVATLDGRESPRAELDSHECARTKDSVAARN